MKSFRYHIILPATEIWGFGVNKVDVLSFSAVKETFGVWLIAVSVKSLSLYSWWCPLDNPENSHARKKGQWTKIKCWFCKLYVSCELFSINKKITWHWRRTSQMRHFNNWYDGFSVWMFRWRLRNPTSFISCQNINEYIVEKYIPIL